MLKCYSNDIDSLVVFVSSAANSKKKKKNNKLLAFPGFRDICLNTQQIYQDKEHSVLLKLTREQYLPFLDGEKMLVSYLSEQIPVQSNFRLKEE